MCSYTTELNVDNKMCPDCFKIRQVGWVFVQSLFDSIHVDTIHIYLIYRYAWWYMYIYIEIQMVCFPCVSMKYRSVWISACPAMNGHYAGLLQALSLRTDFWVAKNDSWSFPVWQNLGHAEEWWGCKGFRRSTFSAVCHWDLHMRSNEHKPRNILYT